MTHLERTAILDSIGGMLEDANDDELLIALGFTSKLMGEGRREHGELDLSADRDWLGEALDEGYDFLFYVLAGKMAHAKRLAEGR